MGLIPVRLKPTGVLFINLCLVPVYKVLDFLNAANVLGINSKEKTYKNI